MNNLRWEPNAFAMFSRYLHKKRYYFETEAQYIIINGIEWQISLSGGSTHTSVMRANYRWTFWARWLLCWKLWFSCACGDVRGHAEMLDTARSHVCLHASACNWMRCEVLIYRRRDRQRWGAAIQVTTVLNYSLKTNIDRGAINSFTLFNSI